jgi:hypothetical protein
MDYQRWMRWSTRLVTFCALASLAFATFEAFDPMRTKPLWRISMWPALMLYASGLAAHSASVLGEVRKPSRLELGFSGLGILLAIGAVYLTACVPGACVAI